MSISDRIIIIVYGKKVSVLKTIHIYIYEMMLFKPVTVYLALAVNNVQLFNA